MATEDLPEQQCHRTWEHVPHPNYEARMNSGHGEHMREVSRCPGVGNFQRVVEPPADPFAGLPEDEEY
jgi:hypothetical protein